MRILSCIVFIIVAAECIFPQSPHGNKLKIDCSNCHESTNWKIIPEHIKFNHNTETPFKLEGQHASVSCQSCHKSLIFSEAKSNCVSCHKDIHQNTLGTNCVTCHTPSSWIVTNIIQIHRNSRFPLLGVHLNVDCASCHSGYSKLYFQPQNISCFSCRRQGNNFKGLTTDCYSCHQANYNSTTNPAHQLAGFPTDCMQCHSQTAWQPSTFDHDNKYFPIYSGNHAGRWNLCSDCHNNSLNFTVFTCINCHEHSQANTDQHHTEVRNYAYSQTSCYSCHPTGRGGD